MDKLTAKEAFRIFRLKKVEGRKGIRKAVQEIKQERENTEINGKTQRIGKRPNRDFSREDEKRCRSTKTRET